MKVVIQHGTIVASLLCLADAANGMVTIPLKSRPISRRDTTGTNVPAHDWILHSADLQWYATIDVGTPPQKFDVIFDTGSYDMFIPQKNCSNCGNIPLFDPDQSSTFNPSPGNRKSFAYGTGVDSTPLPEGGEGVSGVYVTDKVGVAGLSIPDQQFLLADSFDEFFRDKPFQGVMGIGVANATELPSKKPWYWALYNSGQLQSPAISFYYPPGQKDGAEMTLGGVNPSRYKGEMKYFDLVHGGMFGARQSAVYINGEPFVTGSNSIVTFDTGTPYFMTSDSVVADIYSRISPNITKLDREAWGAPCSLVDSIAADFTFTYGSPNGNNINVTMPRSAFNLGPYNGSTTTCQTVFSSGELGSNGDDPDYLIGAPLLKEYYTVWDGLNYKMGFGELA